MADEPKDKPPAPPKLPVQAAIYISPDGEVTFGALFEELIGVAKALDPDATLACDVPPAPPAKKDDDKP